jgi:hypothetical protein
MAWHGASAISGSWETFQAETIIRRESGSRRSVASSSVIWSTWPPSGVGQDRHCLP